MKRSQLKRSAPVRHTPIRGGQIKRKKRTPSEFARIYGSKERVEFVKSLPCAACGIRGFSENAHVLGNDGAGRKAGYATIAPLCGIVPWRESLIGCHGVYDDHRSRFDRSFPSFDAERAAAECEAVWQSHLRQTGRARREETDNND